LFFHPPSAQCLWPGVPSSQAQEPERARIEGVVVDVTTGAPIPLASVRLTGGPAGQNFETTAGSDGSFVIDGLEGGTYRALARHMGFTLPSRNRSAGPQAVIISVLDGQRLDGVRLPLVRPGVIAGAVVDEENHGIPGVSIELFRPGYGLNGMPSVNVFSAAVETGSDGVYRTLDLVPGVYYVRMTSSDLGLPTLYYPGVSSIDRALPITVLPGLEAGGIGFSPQQVSTFSVMLSLIDSNGPSSGARLFLRERARIETHPIQVAADEVETGRYVISGIPPGSYYLVIGSKTDSPPGEALQRMEIDMAARDLDLGTIPVLKRFTISGRVAFPDNVPAMNRLTLMFVQDAGGLPTIYGQIAPDGTFVLENVAEGLYNVGGSIRPGYYIQSARYGSEDLLYSGLRVSGDPPGPLEIVIGGPTGTVQGVVLEAADAPAGNALVYLDPGPDRRKPFDLGRMILLRTMTDQRGSFRAQELPPSEYRVYAWESIPVNAYQNADFVAQYWERGMSIRVEEGGTSQVRLRVIPTE
jgi:hypothetical protein